MEQRISVHCVVMRRTTSCFIDIKKFFPVSRNYTWWTNSCTNPFPCLAASIRLQTCCHLHIPDNFHSVLKLGCDIWHNLGTSMQWPIALYWSAPSTATVLTCTLGVERCSFTATFFSRQGIKSDLVPVLRLPIWERDSVQAWSSCWKNSSRSPWHIDKRQCTTGDEGTVILQRWYLQLFMWLLSDQWTAEEMEIVLWDIW